LFLWAKIDFNGHIIINAQIYIINYKIIKLNAKLKISIIYVIIIVESKF